MKKRVFKLASIATLFVVGGIYTVCISVKRTDVELSELTLANVEALATDENTGIPLDCYTTYTPADWFHKDDIFVDCYDCEQKKGRDLRDRGECYRR